jgi:hypothetical protein
MIVALNLALAIFCLWIAGHLLRIRRKLRRTNRSLQVALINAQQVLSPAPLWLDEKQSSLRQLNDQMVQYGAYWRQLQKSYLLLLFLGQIWPKQRLLPTRRFHPRGRTKG